VGALLHYVSESSIEILLVQACYPCLNSRRERWVGFTLKLREIGVQGRNNRTKLVVGA
jgi:hypothetical protein